MEAARPRTIRVGRASVGLIGLEAALQKVLGIEEIDESRAVEELLAAIRQKNYVPEEAADLYREALRRELRRASGKETAGAKGLVIRILGKDCLSCNRLHGMVIEALARLGVAADVELVHDPDEIYRFGIFATPALVVNGEIKSSGRQPTPARIEEWIKEGQLETGNEGEAFS